MALFPHEHFDPIAYDRFPTDADPELYFAPAPDQQNLAEYNKEIYGGLFFCVLFGGAFFLATQPRLLITIAAFSLAIVFVIYHAAHAAVYYCDILLLNKRLDPEAEQSLQKSLESKIAVSACVKEFLFLAVFLGCFVSFYFLFPESRLFNLSLIVLGFVGVLAYYIAITLFNPDTRLSCTSVMDLWFQADYSSEIPCAFQKVRIASQHRLLFSIVTFALLAAFLPPLAYYFPVACVWESPTEISQYYPIPQDMKQDNHVLESQFGIEKTSYQYLESTTQHTTELFESANSDSATQRQKSNLNERAQLLLNHIKEIRRFQNGQVQQNPTGWLAASFQMIQRRTGPILISWLLSFLLCMLAVCIVFTATTLSVCNRITKEIESAVSQNLSFPTNWEGITHRLVHSSDKYEQESLYLGTFGDE